MHSIISNVHIDTLSSHTVAKPFQRLVYRLKILQIWREQWKCSCDAIAITGAAGPLREEGGPRGKISRAERAQNLQLAPCSPVHWRDGKLGGAWERGYEHGASCKILRFFYLTILYWKHCWFILPKRTFIDSKQWKEKQREDATQKGKKLKASWASRGSSSASPPRWASNHEVQLTCSSSMCLHSQIELLNQSTGWRIDFHADFNFPSTFRDLQRCVLKANHQPCILWYYYCNVDTALWCFYCRHFATI